MNQIKASIIMPTFNRKDLLGLSLQSFNFQDIAHDSFEVIVIDDGSTDGTLEFIHSLSLTFPFQVIRHDVNQGAATARNHGIQAARGEVIIFSDSDCIVPANFVRVHLQYHTQKPDVAICGTIRWRKIFTFYYTGFSEMQCGEFEMLRQNNSYMQKRLDEINFQYVDQTALISADDLQEVEHYSYLPPWSDEYLGAIVKQFGADLTGFAFPWVLFGTSNASIRKEHLNAVGGFDERLLREEDWELGYRLQQYGIRFYCSYEMESAHQEHPILTKRLDRMYKGYEVFFKSHPETMAYLITLHLDNSFDLITLSKGASQYQFLKEQGQLFESVVERFDQLAEQRMAAFLQKKRKSDHFWDLPELAILDAVSEDCADFRKVIRELSRTFEV